MKVVVTREAGRNVEVLSWLPPGVTVEEVPLTTTAYRDLDDVRATLHESSASGTFRSLVVTSGRSARYIDIALAASTPDAEVFCVGPTTAGALEARGVRVKAIGEGTAVSLAREISVGPVLMLGAKAVRGELTEALTAKGLEVVNIACYETVTLTLDASDAKTLRSADVLFVGAPSAWSVAREFVQPDAWVVVPGPTTAAVVHHDHPRVIEGWGPQLATRLAALSTAE